jgi:DNA-3-methyladenine glycosylase II
MPIRQMRGRRRAGQIIATEAHIRAGVRSLIRVCPHMVCAHALVGQPPLRRWDDGFAGLARIVIGQQLSIASAAAILGRVSILVDPLDAATLRAKSDTELCAAGLSAGKAATLRAVANAVCDGRLDFAELADAHDQSVREQLMALRGIGPWTADIYLLFCRGDADAFAAGDLALQIGAQMLMGLPERPTAAELEAIADRWRPWRGVAARLIWAYYGAVKSGAAKTPPTLPAS